MSQQPTFRWQSAVPWGLAIPVVVSFYLTQSAAITTTTEHLREIDARIATLESRVTELRRETETIRIEQEAIRADLARQAALACALGKQVADSNAANRDMEALLFAHVFHEILPNSRAIDPTLFGACDQPRR